MADPNLDAFLGVKPAPAWRRWVKWAAVAIGVALLLLLVYRLFFASDPAPEFATAPATRGDLTVTVSATGKLAPTNQVTVGSQLSGLVTRVVVDVNDRVTAGQPLALIDPEQIEGQIRAGEAQIAANQAQVAQAQATAAQSRAQLARLEEVFRLSGGRVPSRTELENGRADFRRAVAGVRAAEAQVAASRASLAQNQTQRARAIVRSPVTGVVLARQVDPGQTVAASFNTPTLFVIAEDLTRMKLEVAIDEADVGSVQPGQRATFTVDAFPGRTFPAQIARVDLGSNLTVSAASASTTTTGATGQVVSYAADLTVANTSGQLRPGMTATADIVTSERRNVLLIPNAALRFRPAAAGAGRGGGIAGSLTFRPNRNRPERTATVGRGATQTIYVKGADGTPQPVQVQTGDSNGSMTEVLGGGLRPGQQVITGALTGAGDASGSGRRGGASGGPGGGGQRRQGGGGG
jgi:HlyD family secretion protein